MPKTHTLNANAALASALAAGATQVRFPLDVPMLGSNGGKLLRVFWNAQMAGWDANYHGDNPRMIPSKFRPGDVLRFREDYANDQHGLRYRADTNAAPALQHLWDATEWRRAALMPAALIRYTYTVAAVRAERVLEISEADALKCAGGWLVPAQTFTHVIRYKEIWTALYGKRYPWADSWCWIAEMRRGPKVERGRR
jgi:hypothetical protein